jgi:hypothetical protein
VRKSTWLRVGVVCFGLIASAGPGFAQQPAPAQPAQVQPAGGGGIPAVSAPQMAALAKMTTGLTPLIQAAARARDELVAATFAVPRNDAAIRAGTGAIRVAERALASARGDAFAAIQRSPNKLAPDQVAGLIAMGGSLLRNSAGRGGNPGVTAQQRMALAAMTAALTPLTQAVAAARSDLVAASLALPRNDVAIDAKLEAVAVAEKALGEARADAFAGIQKSAASALTPDQVAALITLGGTFRTAGLAFTEPDPMDFNDHEGFVSLFDGVSLKGWDGNPKFWRVENGAMIGESTVENPSGNSYIAYRDIEARDFTLKLEIKIEGSGGSGVQYRSKTGLPWLGTIPANVGPVNLNWMMTGPQADFWPSTPVYTGQFYSENTPMRILAWRGQVVEGFGSASKRLIGTIGDRQALGNFVKMNDWNEYIIIARGGTFIHILNGQLMTVMIDDDPASSNNQSGQIGIEIEAITKVFVRNIWLKKVR